MNPSPLRNPRLLLATASLLTIAAPPALPAAAQGPGAPAGCDPSWVSAFGAASGADNVVRALAVFDDGSGGGPALYVGGELVTPGGVAASHIAKWDGSTWSPLGSGVSGPVNALAVFDDGSGTGPALYAGGFFTVAGDLPANRIAKWDGSTWSPLGSGVSGGPVRALAVFDDGSGGGPALHVGGHFTTAGGIPANRIARWDGSAWSPLGSGFGAPSDSVRALLEFDDGSGGGPALYVGGGFTAAGGVAASNIARWDGSTWSALGGGVSSFVLSLEVFDDGSGGGPALHAGGYFSSAGGLPATAIAKWDGSAWSGLDSGLTAGDTQPFIAAMRVFDDGTGSGPALYAGGNFSAAGGGAAKNIVRWDGSVWWPLGIGLNSYVLALEEFDDSGPGPALFAGGAFTASPAGDPFLAKWGCAPLIAPFCFGDGSGTACPCGNPGGQGQGCGNSTGAGAVLAGGGSSDVSMDDLVLEATGLPPNDPAILFVGLHAVDGGAGITFGDGLRCVWGGIVRLDVLFSDPQGQVSWGPGLASLNGWQPGDVRRFQSWYRDPHFFGCVGYNLTNGLAVTFH